MRNVFIICILLLSQSVLGQVPKQHSASFELGNGLGFSLNNGKHYFAMGGMIQPYFALGMDSSGQDVFLNAKRAYFNLQGSVEDEKVTFFLQTNFATITPLLDGWVGYHPFDFLDIYFGQRQSIANNREMMLMEDQLQFADRSALSTAFSETGREMGLFIESNFDLGSIRIAPKLAVTSGDGINSFGMDSRDIDLGGFKYSARIDLYPFGPFSDGNDRSVSDFAHEESPKLVAGFAVSNNDGVSHSKGEGHNEFTLYNRLAEFQRPDYRQMYFDLLFKFQGFSLLGEYHFSSASGLTGAYLNESATVELMPTQISEFLALGSAYNVQLGYVTLNGWGVDGRFSSIMPEYEENANSIIQQTTSWRAGIVRYAKQNDLKTVLSYGQRTTNEDYTYGLAEIMLQVRF